MTENIIGKGDVQATALNDIENCTKDLFSFSGEEPVEEKWQELNLSIQTAQDLGVTPEYILSKLLNSLPEFVKQQIIEKLVEKCNLSAEEVEQIQAPID